MSATTGLELWPSVETIVEAFDEVVSILHGFADLSATVEAVADGVPGADGLTDDETRRWVAERREIVESVAYLFGSIVAPGDGQDRVEPCIREALDIITGGSTAAHAVIRRDRYR